MPGETPGRDAGKRCRRGAPPPSDRQSQSLMFVGGLTTDVGRPCAHSMGGGRRGGGGYMTRSRAMSDVITRCWCVCGSSGALAATHPPRPPDRPPDRPAARPTVRPTDRPPSRPDRGSPKRL